MNKEPLMKKLEGGDYLGIVEHLLNEVERLEGLLEAERICRKATEKRALKAEHDRDRYSARLKEYQNLKQAAAEVIREGGQIVIVNGGMIS